MVHADVDPTLCTQRQLSAGQLFNHRQVYIKQSLRLNPKADPGPAHQVRPTPFEKFVGFVFVNVDCITRIYTLIVVMMQCLHYVFYTLL